MVSMEKAGNSWAAACISEVYEKTTGILVKWKHEISREIAIKPEFPLPEGWCSVYDVSPVDVLARKYDKIIILERDLGVLKRVFWQYHVINNKKLRNISYKNALQRFPQFFLDIEHYHALVYAHEIEDDRVIWCHLEDLNNFAVDAFNELLDFLHFPKKRAPLIPITPPERNWEAYPDLFPKGYIVNEKLKLMELRYALDVEKAQLLSQKMLNRLHDDSIELNRKKGLEYKYGYSQNPYKMSPEEKERQENRSFRILLDRTINDILYMPKILVLGPRGHGIRAHFAENLHDSLEILHHESVFLSSLDFKNAMTPEEWRYHGFYKHEIKLSSLKIMDASQHEFHPDLIFIDEFDLRFKNDVSTPVFYNHKYLHRMLNCEDPDAIFFCHDEYLNYYKKYISPKTFQKHVLQEILYPAVNHEIYKPKLKKRRTLMGIGYRRSFDEWITMGEIAKEPHVKILQQEIEAFKKLGYPYEETPISDEKYRELLPIIDAIWFPIPRNQYISQRMLEAMACKVLCFILLESDRHEAMLFKMGFKKNEHYIGLQALDEIPSWMEKLYQNKSKLRWEIVLNAFNLVREKHTYIKRTRDILAFYDAYYNPYGSKKEEKQKSRILNLGCGTAIINEALNVDIADLPGVDLIHDLNEYPYPLEHASFDVIIMDDVIEHVKDPIRCLKECHALLKPHGELRIKVVHWNHEYSYSDPTHLHAFGPIYWEFFTGKRRSYYMDFQFEDLELSYIFDSRAIREFGSDEQVLLQQAVHHSNIIQAMQVSLYKEGKKAKLEVQEVLPQKLDSILPQEDVEIKPSRPLKQAPPPLKTRSDQIPSKIPSLQKDTKTLSFKEKGLLAQPPKEEIPNLEQVDVILPLYWVNLDYFEENLHSWFQELPIKRLLVGINNPDLYRQEHVMSLLKNEKILIIDQTSLKTLGKCLADLMARTQTDYFVYVHSDVRLTPQSFTTMKTGITPDIGILESALRKNTYSDGHSQITDMHSKRERSYSGFQLFKKKAILGILDKIRDDYIYRNEDLIFQQACLDAGYRYEKSPALHEHQLTNSNWTTDHEHAMEMQWKGIAKYVTCNSFTQSLLRPALMEWMHKFEHKHHWREVVEFVDKLKDKNWKLWFNNLI